MNKLKTLLKTLSIVLCLSSLSLSLTPGCSAITNLLKEEQNQEVLAVVARGLIAQATYAAIKANPDCSIYFEYAAAIIATMDTSNVDSAEALAQLITESTAFSNFATEESSILIETFINAIVKSLEITVSDKLNSSVVTLCVNSIVDGINTGISRYSEAAVLSGIGIAIPDEMPNNPYIIE